MHSLAGNFTQVKLYRGDSLPSPAQSAGGRDRGRTFANLFCGSGLIAKFDDRGSSEILKGGDLLDFVLCHVGYDVGRSEQDFADHSPLIAFSEDPDTAFNFSERTGQKDLEECVFENATHFVWELTIELPPYLEPGRYRFTYKADPSNCWPFIRERFRRGVAREAETGNPYDLACSVRDGFAAVYAGMDQSEHYAELIDVVTYVEAQDTSRRESRLVANTLARSRRDREWLLYPQDPNPEGCGSTGVFRMNRHLRPFQWFRVRTKC